jgi:hypothetical protein
VTVDPDGAVRVAGADDLEVEVCSGA